jgi:hypothetical protein
MDMDLSRHPSGYDTPGQDPEEAAAMLRDLDLEDGVVDNPQLDKLRHESAHAVFGDDSMKQ